MKNKYSAAIVGESAREGQVRRLSDFGYRVFVLPRNPRLERAVSSHADLSILIIKGCLFVSEQYYNENREIIDELCNFSSLTLTLTKSEPCSPYPHDTCFCALNCDDKVVFANKRSFAKEAAVFCARERIRLIHTNQGYAKCTSLYFGGSVISADPSLTEAARKVGFRVLKISQGGIVLPGYSYGFIGGASGFDGENIYFCGDIASHPDGELIVDFIKEKGYSAVSLDNGELLDIGSIIFA